MKKSLCWAILATILSLGVYCSSARAQAPVGQGQPIAGARIALADVSKILQNHARLKGMKEDMKADFQRADQQFKEEQQKLRKLSEGLQQYNRGTPDYKAIDEELVDRSSRLRARVERVKADFADREARMYQAAYQELWQATDYICRQYGFDIVFNFNSDKPDPDKPQTVLNQIQGTVVWYDQRLDITDAVLREVNRSQANPNRQADERGQPARPANPFNQPR